MYRAGVLQDQGKNTVANELGSQTVENVNQ